jgi:hypothetical protein
MRILGSVVSLTLGVGGALASAPLFANTPPVADTGFAPALELISVHDIQLQLLARGYDPGPATGIVTAATERAIRAFERDYGLPQDGIAGPVLQNWLHFLPRRPRPAPSPAMAMPNPPSPPAYAAAPPVPPMPTPAPSYAAAIPVPLPDSPAAMAPAPGTPPEAPAPPGAPDPAPSVGSDAAGTVAPDAAASASPPPTPAGVAEDVGATASASAAADAANAIPTATPNAAESASTPLGAPAIPDSPPSLPSTEATVAPPQPNPPPTTKDASAAAATPPAAPPAATASAAGGPPPDAPAPPEATAAAAPAANAAGVASTVAMLAPILAPEPHENETNSAKAGTPIPPGKLGPLDPQPIAAPRIAVDEGPPGSQAKPIPPAPAAATVAAASPPPPPPRDAPLFTGDAAVREAQLYLKQLGFYHGQLDGVMSWDTVEALVKFDASGAGPKSVIADPSHPDSTWLARLKMAAAAKDQ